MFLFSFTNFQILFLINNLFQEKFSFSNKTLVNLKYDFIRFGFNKLLFKLNSNLKEKNIKEKCIQRTSRMVFYTDIAEVPGVVRVQQTLVLRHPVHLNLNSSEPENSLLYLRSNLINSKKKLNHVYQNNVVLNAKFP